MIDKRYSLAKLLSVIVITGLACCQSLPTNRTSLTEIPPSAEPYKVGTVSCSMQPDGNVSECYAGYANPNSIVVFGSELSLTFDAAKSSWNMQVAVREVAQGSVPGHVITVLFKTRPSFSQGHDISFELLPAGAGVYRERR